MRRQRRGDICFGRGCVVVILAHALRELAARTDAAQGFTGTVRHTASLHYTSGAKITTLISWLYF